MNVRTLSTAVLATGLVVGLGGVAAGASLAKDDRGSDLAAAAQARVSETDVSGQAVTSTLVGKNTLRLSGADRYETAVAISQAGWDDTNTEVVFLATGANYADALAIAASAGGAGPLLLTQPTVLPAVVEAEIARLKPCAVVIAGGRGAVSDAVALKADALADVTRCEQPTATPSPSPTPTATEPAAG